MIIMTNNKNPLSPCLSYECIEKDEHKISYNII